MRILFITATRIGDAVISTGLLAHLVEKNPGAKITVACGPLAESLFTSVPGLERVIVLSKKSFSRHWFRLWADVRSHHWDIVVDLRRSLIPYFIRANKRFRLAPDDHRSHRVELLSQLFGLIPPRAPIVWVSEKEKSAAVGLLAGSDTVIALCPTAARPEKTWPSDRFLALAQSLLNDVSRLPDLKLLLVGAEQDRSILTYLADSLPDGRTIVMAGCPNLQRVSAALSLCATTVANDSGLAHLAAASGCPTVALFGPTREDLYRPWGMRVSVVQAPQNQGDAVIADISVDDVVASVHSILD